MRTWFCFWASAFLNYTVAIAQGDPNASACGTVSAILSVCESLTPGFTSFTNFNFQAPCLCYASTYWYPNGYDGWLGSCYAGYKTANPTAYASFTASIQGPPDTTPCHQVGNILSSSQFTGPVTALYQPMSTPSITDINESACATLNVAAGCCDSITPGFSTITDFRVQASCYCYSGLVWDPSAYDAQWGSCVKYISTASPSLYSEVSAGGAPVLTSTPCAAVSGILDIRQSSTSSNRQTVTSASSASSASKISSKSSSAQVGSSRSSTLSATATGTALPSSSDATTNISVS
jgi:hypothetical protein